MNPREERGLVIAATCRLNRLPDGTWLVPSQSSRDSIYRVNLEAKTCTCPDYKEGGNTCKHFYAASIAFKRDVLPDGTVIETKTITLTERKTYKQDWPAYNLAQATEKRRVRVLLHDLCRKLPYRERGTEETRGRKAHHPSDAVFAMVYKVYSGFSGRRFSTDLEEAYEKGFLTRPIPGAKVYAFLSDPYYTPILKQLIGYSARPLRSVETSFAIDSSGFSTSRYERWYDHKYGITRLRCMWVKTHIASGVKTNCITAVRILDKDAADCPQFVPLIKETKEHFEIGEVSADKAYLSVDNFEEVAGCGGQAFIAFKSNSTGEAGGAFEKAYHYFRFNQDEYLLHYHKRSNVESTFSAVKRKFGSSVLSKTDAGMVNEVLCKCLAHNLTCLVQEEETLGISPVFWKDEEQEREEGDILPFVRS